MLELLVSSGDKRQSFKSGCYTKCKEWTTGDLRSSFNHLSAINCHFLMKAALSALGNLKLVSTTSQQVNNREMFMSYLEKEMTALLPRETRTHLTNVFPPWFFLRCGSYQLSCQFIVQLSTSLQVEVKVFASLCLAQLSINSKAVSAGSLFSRNSWPLLSFCMKDSPLMKENSKISHNLCGHLCQYPLQRDQEILQE